MFILPQQDGQLVEHCSTGSPLPCSGARSTWQRKGFKALSMKMANKAIKENKDTFR